MPYNRGRSMTFDGNVRLDIVRYERIGLRCNVRSLSHDLVVLCLSGHLFDRNVVALHSSHMMDANVERL